MQRSNLIGVLLLSVAIAVSILFVSCETPMGQSSKGNGSNSIADRGNSALLINTVKSSYLFNVDLTSFVQTAKGEFIALGSGKTLFNQNILLVPLFSNISGEYMFTKYDGQAEDPRSYFGQLDPAKIRSPFDISSIDYNVRPVDEIEFLYYVIDGQVALDEFRKLTGLVTNIENPKELRYFPQMASIPSLAVTNSEVTLICLLKQKVFRVTRKEDLFCQDFLARKQLTDIQSIADFYNDYGDATCTSMDLGGYVILLNTYYCENNKYSPEEVRNALAEYAASFFNISGIKPLTEKTTNVMNSLQATLPYYCANSGSGLTLPSFSNKEMFPQMLDGFTAKMKNGNNLWLTDLTYTKY